MAKSGNNNVALIPNGEFEMGTEDSEVDQLLQAGKRLRPPLKANDFQGEVPLHRVKVSAFQMAIHQVTAGQYKEFLNETGHPALPGWALELALGDDYPVVGVSWNDAMAYCEWKGARLPTEAEWEKAARGGLVGKKYPWGDEWDADLGTDGAGLRPVGKLPPNGYGIHGMVGNVWEWCSDWYEKDYYAVSSEDNPTGPEKGLFRVVRGGGWNLVTFNLRVARRNKYPPNSKTLTLGFRCAWDA